MNSEHDCIDKEQTTMSLKKYNDLRNEFLKFYDSLYYTKQSWPQAGGDIVDECRIMRSHRQAAKEALRKAGIVL